MDNLAILVPYRDREEHRKFFIPNMKAHLKNTGIQNYKIYFIEQEQGKLFNRGKLLNIGFDLTKNNHNIFCFHDIDMLPVDENCIYKIKDEPVHLANYISQFNYVYQEKYFGGVCLFSKQHFESINGFYNNFWGWGAEDDDLLLRLERNKIKFVKKPGKYKSLFHEPNGDAGGGYPNSPTKPHILKNREILNNHKKDIFYNGSSDGLNNLEYKLLETKSLENLVTIFRVLI